MPRGKYKHKKRISDKFIEKISSKYSKVRNFIEEHPSLYSLASQRRLLPKITKKMFKEKKEHNYWNKEKILESSKNEETKLDWLTNDPKAYHAARRLGCLKEATKHMQPLGSLHSRCIYAIEVSGKKIVYIGLTYNFKRRVRDHLKSERIISLKKRYGVKKIISKQLTKYLKNQEAIFKEGEFVKLYKKKGYKILNLTKTGGLGGTTVKHTKDKILKKAKNYNTIRDWLKNDIATYRAAHAMNILPEATKHMEKLWEKKWNEKKVWNSIKGIKVASHWRKKHPGAEPAARRLGIYKEIKNKFIDGRSIEAKKLKG